MLSTLPLPPTSTTTFLRCHPPCPLPPPTPPHHTPFVLSPPAILAPLRPPPPPITTPPAPTSRRQNGLEIETHSLETTTPPRAPRLRAAWRVGRGGRSRARPGDRRGEGQPRPGGGKRRPGDRAESAHGNARVGRGWGAGHKTAAAAGSLCTGKDPSGGGGNRQARLCFSMAAGQRRNGSVTTAGRPPPPVAARYSRACPLSLTSSTEVAGTVLAAKTGLATAGVGSDVATRSI